MTQILVKASSGAYYSADILQGSSFALELNQPLLDTEHIPVPFSTNISFPPTKTNKELFRYLPVLMAEPSEKELEAALLVDGIVLAKGVITYTGIESGNLQYAFAGRNLEDGWKRKIWDPSEALVAQVVDAAYVDQYNRPLASGFVRFPTILDKKYEQTPWGSFDNAARAYYRYYNWNPEIGSMVFERGLPVVYLKPVIMQASGSLGLNGPVNTILARLGICGQYGAFRQERTEGYNMLTYPGLVKTNVFNALPDVTISEIIKDLLKMTCSAIFRQGAEYKMISASDCLESEASDISGKISDIYASSVETGKAYAFTYSGSDAGGDDLTESPRDFTSLKALLDSVLASGRELGDLNTVRHSTLKDIYSLCGAASGYTGHPMTAGSLKSRSLGKIDVGAENTETFDSSIASIPVACQPDYVPIREPVSGGYAEKSVPRMIPAMEVPAAEGERGKEVLMGLLDGYQMCDKGRILSQTQTADIDLGVSLGVDDLFNRYHSKFASWIAKSRQVVRAELNFNAFDVANIRMQNRFRFAGRYWLARKISVTITAGGRLKTEGEFVSV